MVPEHLYCWVAGSFKCQDPPEKVNSVPANQHIYVSEFIMCAVSVLLS